MSYREEGNSVILTQSGTPVWADFTPGQLASHPQRLFELRERGENLMAKVIGNGEIKGEVTLVLSEAEAKALDALAGYGVDQFLITFYKHLGKAYLEPHERGLRSLFDSVRTGEGSVSSFLKRIHDARDVFTGRKESYDPPVHGQSIQEVADVQPKR